VVLIASGMVWSAFFGERDQWKIDGKIVSSLLFIFSLILIANNYIGNEVIVATVYAVSKTVADEKVKVLGSHRLISKHE